VLLASLQADVGKMRKGRGRTRTRTGAREGAERLERRRGTGQSLMRCAVAALLERMRAVRTSVVLVELANDCARSHMHIDLFSAHDSSDLADML
jgi:hypothetical protein